MSAPPAAVMFYTASELQTLRERGVNLPNPEQVSIGREVPLGQIEPGAILYPFSRLSGAQTWVHHGAKIGLHGAATLENSIVGPDSVIGQLGPVTLIDTVTGPRTVLGAGVAEKSVFLGKETQVNDFTTGFGFRVRKGSLYEEDASSAQHTDTKMTILFPWVTLGSNINFCDLILTGGIGPESGQFTEVGSGTIHFNFTLRGDKATASLFGNVTQGVFLRQKRLFLGGNNSLLGPITAEFGACTAAGIRALGHLAEGLNLGQGVPTGHRDYNPQIFSQAKEIVAIQVSYIGQLTALYHWYGEVRSRLAQGDPPRRGLYKAAQQIIVMNIKERLQQLDRFVQSLERSVELLTQEPLPPRGAIEEQKQLLIHWPRLQPHLAAYHDHVWDVPQAFLQGLEESAEENGLVYTSVIHGLSVESLEVGKSWLQAIVHRCEHFFKSEMKD